MIEICRDHSTNVKRWRDGQMALRWCAAGMLEAAKQLRRVNGFPHLPALRAGLDAHVNGTVIPRVSGWGSSRLTIIGRHPKFHGTRDILSSRSACTMS